MPNISSTSSWVFVFCSWVLSRGVIPSRGVTWLTRVSAAMLVCIVVSCIVNNVGISFLSDCVANEGVGKESFWIVTMCLV